MKRDNSVACIKSETFFVITLLAYYSCCQIDRALIMSERDFNLAILALKDKL